MAGYPEPHPESKGEVQEYDDEVESVQGLCSEMTALKKGPAADSRWARNLSDGAQAVKLLPQPQPPVALGLLKVKPEPCMEVT
jgi:hypothetical protein